MKKRCLLAAGCLVVLLVSSQPAAAVDESKPCILEPTAQPIAYGDVLSGPNCQLLAADVDLFRFPGAAGEAVRAVAVDLSDNGFIGVCLELIGPGPDPVIPLTCGNTSVQIDATLTETGIYTLIVSEQGNDSGFFYNLSLERVSPPRDDWPRLDIESLMSDEISPAGDLDAFRLYGTAGDTIRIVVADLSFNAFIAVCAELFGPDGARVGNLVCGDASATINATLTSDGIHSVIVSEGQNRHVFPYNISFVCLSGTCAFEPHICEIGLSSTAGTLNIDFTLGSETPATWSVWLSLQNMMHRLWSVGPLTIDPVIQFPISVPGFPPLGNIGFLTTMTTPGAGIVCSDWDTVDTGEPTPGAAAPTAEQLRRLLPLRRP